MNPKIFYATEKIDIEPSRDGITTFCFGGKARWDIVGKAIKTAEMGFLTRSPEQMKTSRELTILMRKAMYGNYKCFCKIEDLMSQGCQCGGQ